MQRLLGRKFPPARHLSEQHATLGIERYGRPLLRHAEFLTRPLTIHYRATEYCFDPGGRGFESCRALWSEGKEGRHSCRPVRRSRGLGFRPRLGRQECRPSLQAVEVLRSKNFAVARRCSPESFRGCPQRISPRGHALAALGTAHATARPRPDFKAASISTACSSAAAWRAPLLVLPALPSARRCMLGFAPSSRRRYESTPPGRIL